MMPKTLNVKKLEKKFASLTRSRESIQGLSSWIMHHKEFYKEIVQEWLSALTKEDFNTLTMFYVANDVIQNCGRKKAPEFRDAFSEALEKAVCLEKVKAIKSDVARLLTIWNEREIYDDVFYKRLEIQLNTVEEEKPCDDVELTDSEIIANFKVNNLINCLQNLRKLEDLLQEKEVILKDLEEPAMPNLENVIVKMDSQNEIKKLDEYYESVEEYITLASSVEEARKAVLRELKYSSVYYSIQSEDVKKVAHAYRIYGKKLKIMEKMVSEKMSDFGETFQSSKCNNSPYIHDASSNVSEKSPNNDSSLPELQNISTEDKANESHDLTKELKQKPELKIENLDENISSEKSNEDMNSGYVEKTNISVTGVSTENCTLEDTFQDNNKDDVTDKSSTTNSISGNIEDTANSVDRYSTEVDFLLEKAYDNRHIKSKSSIKRKIETLLNAKSKKTCHTPSETDVCIQSVLDSDHPTTSPLENIGLDSLLMKSKASEPEINSNTCHTVLANKIVEQNSEASTSTLEANLDDKTRSEDFDAVNKNESLDKVKTEEAEKENKAGITEEQNKLDTSVLSNNLNADKTVSTDSVLYSTLSDIPTELLKNILHKNQINMALNSKCNLGNEDSASFCNKLTTTDRTDEKFQNHDNKTKEQSSIQNPVDDNQSNISPKIISPPDDLLNNDIKIPGLMDVIHPSNSFFKGKSFTSLQAESSISKFNEKEEAQSYKNLKSDGDIDENCHRQEKPNLIETLRNVLTLISKKEASFNQAVKDHISHNPPTVMPIENTLKIYNYMMQCYEQTSAKKELLSSDSSEKVDAINVQSNKSVTERSSEHSQISSVTCSTKEDNLEIMDMEVDSGDETMDS